MNAPGWNRSLSLPENVFTRTGHTFTGWSFVANNSPEINDLATIDNINEHIVLYAFWEPNQYTLSFSDNGGSGSMDDVSYFYGKNFKLPNVLFSRPGHTFVGWSESANGPVQYNNEQEIAINQLDEQLFAVWQIKDSYMITFNENGGVGSMTSMSITEELSANLTANTFTKDGYFFSGWSRNQNGAVEFLNNAPITMGASNVTLYAIWTQNPTTSISYHANGGQGTMESHEVQEGENVILTAMNFIKAGYRFTGWSTELNGEVAYADSASFVMGSNDLNLYATWEADDLSEKVVTFDTIPSTLSGDWLRITDDCPSGLAPCYRSTYAMDDNEKSVLTIIKNTNKGMLRFRWKVSSEEYYDECYLEVNGTRVDEISGTFYDWAQYNYYISSEGETTFQWTYEKDEYYGEGSDACFIDQIEFP